MESFRKLKLNLPTDDADDLDRLSLKRTFYKWQKYGLSLLKTRDYEAVENSQYTLDSGKTTRILALLPQSLLDVEIPEVWVFNGTPKTENSPMLAPHRDLVRLCGINSYFDTNGERTVFYRYERGNLYEESSFVAKDGDCYVLDVDKPHAVELVSGCTRKFMSISFINTPYSEVVRHFA